MNKLRIKIIKINTVDTFAEFGSVQPAAPSNTGIRKCVIEWLSLYCNMDECVYEMRWARTRWASIYLTV